MKHEIGIIQPDYLIEDWPNKFEAFSWLEYVVTVPNPIFLITTRKANGTANANLHSWGLLIGSKDHYMSVLALMDTTHTYANILREREWCINIPSVRHYAQCSQTIQCNEPDNDEITDAGFTLEAAKLVKAPRIAECLFNLECQLEWERCLSTGNQWYLLAGRVVHAAVDEAAMVPEPNQRLQALGLMYNVRSTINPLDGRYYGPNTLGLLNQVLKIVPDDIS